MINILANDGISQSGKDALDNAGFTYSTLAAKALASLTNSDKLGILFMFFYFNLETPDLLEA